MINQPHPQTEWEKRAIKAEQKLRKAEKRLEELDTLTHNKTVVLEQRAKIDTRTNILRASIGLNCGLVAGLLVHFLTNCK